MIGLGVLGRAFHLLAQQAQSIVGPALVEQVGDRGVGRRRQQGHGRQHKSEDQRQPFHHCTTGRTASPSRSGWADKAAMATSALSGRPRVTSVRVRLEIEISTYCFTNSPFTLWYT